MVHTVMIVEDDESLRELMRVGLELNGYVVIAFADGKAAFDSLSELAGISVILLDLEMPRMNGWDFYERMRTTQPWQKVPVVIHSSSTPVPDGVSHVLAKPVPLATLLSVLGEVCAAPS